jgi:hypothetical protein
MVTTNESIDPRVRLATSPWPEDAPSSEVSTFCSGRDISRRSSYELRKPAEADGRLSARVREPRSGRPG